jgi:hypothetical protein
VPRFDLKLDGCILPWDVSVSRSSDPTEEVPLLNMIFWRRNLKITRSRARVLLSYRPRRFSPVTKQKTPRQGRGDTATKNGETVKKLLLGDVPMHNGTPQLYQWIS